MFWGSIALALLACLLARAEVDPCKRQPFRGRCPSVNGAPLMRSQFVLRYYLRGSECVSYPYGHCANDDNEPKLFRYKEECEDYCIKGIPRETNDLGENLIASKEVVEEATETPPVTYATSKPLEKSDNDGYETPKTECQRQRNTNDHGLVKGGFVPRCTPNGEFQQLQCEQDESECFCVNSEGIEIDNSRIKGNKPDCEEIISASPQRTNECVGGSESGPCTNEIQRWFYDEETQTCRQFTYSGCGGNGNNYPTEAACQRRCLPTKESGKCHRGLQPLKTAQGKIVNCAKTDCPAGYKCSVIQQSSVCCPDIEKSPVGSLHSGVSAEACDLPKERGPCDRYELRFYYNKDLKECKYFFFGGCEGNDNNFARVEDCERTCGAVKSSQDPSSSNPEKVVTIIQTSTTSQTSTTTSTTTTEAPTTTRRPTTTTTEARTQPPVVTLGPPIDLPKEVEVRTFPPSTTPELPTDRCLHPEDSGTCGGQFVRWLWNQENKKCESFAYTGCGGNGNNFASQEECLSICHVEVAKPEPLPDVIDVCESEIDAGECTGSFMRYAFDESKGDCRQFQYGGCGGNGNNFATISECRKKCVPSKGTTTTPATTLATPAGSTSLNVELLVTPSLNICEHPIEIGECSGIFQRFAYDAESNECRPFEYGGCGGNGNNFATITECRSACVRVRCPPTPHCDVTQCQVVQDNRGCPFCSCPPPPQHPPLVPKFTPEPHCPPLDVNRCVEPCIIFSNRQGCQECVCPVLPSQLPPQVLPPTLPRPPPREPLPHPPPPSPEVSMPRTIRPSPPAPAQPPAPPSPPGPNVISTPNLPVQPSQRGIPNVVPSKVPPPPPASIPVRGDLGEKCSQPVDPGPCKKFVERWHFNSDRGECEPFQYGGCAGNRNHFYSRRECEIHCARFSRVPEREEIVHVPVTKVPSPQTQPPPPPPVQTRPPPPPVQTRPPRPTPSSTPSYVQTRPPVQSTVFISQTPALSRTSLYTREPFGLIQSTQAPLQPAQRVPVWPFVEQRHTSQVFVQQQNRTSVMGSPLPTVGIASTFAPSTTTSEGLGSSVFSRISEVPSRKPVVFVPTNAPEGTSESTTRPLPSPQIPVEKSVPLKPIAQVPHFQPHPPQLPPKLPPVDVGKQFAQPIFNEASIKEHSNISPYQPPNPPVRLDYQNPPKDINSQYIPPQPPVVPGFTPEPPHPVVPHPQDLWPANVAKPKGGSYNMEAIQNTRDGMIKIKPIESTSTASPSTTVEVITVAPTTTVEVITEVPTTTVENSEITVEVGTTVGNSETTVEGLETIVPHSEQGHEEEVLASGHKTASLLPEEEEGEPQAPGYGPDSVLTAERTTKTPEEKSTVSPSSGGEYKVFGEKSNVRSPIAPPGNPESSNSASAFASREIQLIGNSIGRKPITLPDSLIDGSVDGPVDELIDGFVGKSVNKSIDRLVNGSIDEVVDRVIDGSVDGLVDGFVKKSDLIEITNEENKNSGEAKILPTKADLIKNEVRIEKITENTTSSTPSSTTSKVESTVPPTTVSTTAFKPRPLPTKPSPGVLPEVFGPPQVPVQEDETCVLPPDAGNCTNFIPRYFYNAEKGFCQEFSYGSCGGNANNFLDRNSCENKCGLPAATAALPERCKRPKDGGSGKGYFPSWYFNPKNLRCEQMVFRGSGGNDNRFETQRDCENVCNLGIRIIPKQRSDKPQKKPLPPPVQKGSTNVESYDGNQIQELPDNPPASAPNQPAPEPPAPEAPAAPEPPAASEVPEAPEPPAAPEAPEAPAAPEVPKTSGYGAEPALPKMTPTGKESQSIIAPSPQGGLNYQDGSPKQRGVANVPKDKDIDLVNDFDLLSGGVPEGINLPEEPTEAPRIPVCPNGLDEMKYADGRSVMCLPGKNQCPQNSVCYFNGMDFFCCPNADDPYDTHIFGGYDGEEVKHGYKSIPTQIHIQTLKRFRRQALPPTAFSIDHITKPLRFDDKPVTQISRAGSVDKLAHLRVNPCTQVVDKGSCNEAHLRYFYDIKVDSCRLFYYSGCGGNSNNFATKSGCEQRCKLGIVITTTTEQPKVLPGRCPGGKLPLGENAPVLCGNQADSIGCPVGYYCRQGPPDVCCPEDPINLQSILTSRKKEIRRKPFISSAGNANGHHHHHEHHHAHGVATEQGGDGYDAPAVSPGGDSVVPASGANPSGASTVPTSGANPSGESTVPASGANPSGESTVPTSGANPSGASTVSTSGASPGAQPVNSVPSAAESGEINHEYSQPSSGVSSAETSQSSGGSGGSNPISIPLPENMCPDGSDALLESNGKAKSCGAGFDGHELCPKGYYCSMDLERDVRLCCPLAIQASNIPPPPVDAPYFGHRRANPGEIVERGSLPSDPKPPKLSTPKPRAPIAPEELENNVEGETVAEFGGNDASGISGTSGVSGGTSEGASGVSETSGVSGTSGVPGGASGLTPNGYPDASGPIAVPPAEMPLGGQEVPYGHMFLKPVDRHDKLREIIFSSMKSPESLVEDGHVRIDSAEDPFEIEGRRSKTKTTLDKSLCHLKPTEGRVCREDEPSPKTNLQYYYSIQDKKCKLFFHHGCGGNGNRFDSKSECERYCVLQQ